MRYIVVISLILAGCVKTFEARVKDGNAMSRTPAGAAYERTLTSSFHSAMLACASSGVSGAVGTFTLVADIWSDGTVALVEAQPKTEISSCFAKHLHESQLPVPPSAPYPLTIEMTVQP